MESHFRTMHYVDVVYLNDKGQYGSSKQVHYTEKEAAEMYLRTINKLKQEKKSALIQLRDEQHQLIKCERL